MLCKGINNREENQLLRMLFRNRKKEPRVTNSGLSSLYIS